MRAPALYGQVRQPEAPKDCLQPTRRTFIWSYVRVQRIAEITIARGYNMARQTHGSLGSDELSPTVERSAGVECWFAVGRCGHERVLSGCRCSAANKVQSR